MSASAFPADYSVAVVSVKEKPLCETFVGWITDDFPLCQTVLCRGSAFFQPCEIIIECVTDDFPPCEAVLCRGFAFFPPCETFVGWVMKEFPCRKVVRDGYEVHCLPAIRLVTVTDGVFAIAIGLEMFTEEIASLTKQFVKLTEEIASLQSSP